MYTSRQYENGSKGSCENANRIQVAWSMGPVRVLVKECGSIKMGELFDQISDCNLLKMCSAPCRYLKNICSFVFLFLV
jgi:hypothetical protein